MKKVLFSPAKLNLGLLVFPIGQHSLHNIFSIFQKISLGDTLSFEYEQSRSPRLSITGEGIIFPTDQSNSLFKVFNAYKDKMTLSIKIHIKKNIPLGSGMGGSSSNAATFMSFLNQVCSLNESLKDQNITALSIGSDVPFFLGNARALVEGVGDQVTPLSSTKMDMVLVYPNIHCDTKQVYQAFDSLKANDPKPQQQEYLLKHGIGDNMLLEASFLAYPLLKECYHKLETLTQSKVYMTGSGSTFFIPCQNKTAAEQLCTTLQKQCPDFFITAAHTLEQ